MNKIEKMSPKVMKISNNCYEIMFSGIGTYLQYQGAILAFVSINEEFYLDKFFWNKSQNAINELFRFFGIPKEEIEEKIKNKEIKLLKLNQQYNY